jgi:hypothetical protein
VRRHPAEARRPTPQLDVYRLEQLAVLHRPPAAEPALTSVDVHRFDLVERGAGVDEQFEWLAPVDRLEGGEDGAQLEPDDLTVRGGAVAVVAVVRHPAPRTARTPSFGAVGGDRQRVTVDFDAHARRGEPRGRRFADRRADERARQPARRQHEHACLLTVPPRRDQTGAPETSLPLLEQRRRGTPEPQCRGQRSATSGGTELGQGRCDALVGHAHVELGRITMRGERLIERGDESLNLGRRSPVGDEQPATLQSVFACPRPCRHPILVVTPQPDDHDALLSVVIQRRDEVRRL